MRIRHIKGAELAVAKDELVIQDPQRFKGKWRECAFKRKAALFLEIGMGMGLFLRTFSLLQPEVNFLGLEKNTTVLYKAIKRYRNFLNESKDVATKNAPQIFKAESQDFSQGNLRFLNSDARFLGEYFAEGEVERLYLNFPDPWPKEKNKARRLTSPSFLKIYAQILKPKGFLQFKTDNEDFFLYSLKSLDASGWSVRAFTRDLLHDKSMSRTNIMTEYEKKFTEMGNPIFEIIASL